MSDNLGEKSRLDTIIERGFVRIGVRWSPSAEQYIDPNTGEPSGIVGRLGQQLARDLGVRPEFVDLAWADHIPALLDGRIDICMKHTNTPQRALLINFSTGRVLKYEGKILIRRDSDLSSEIDINKAERVIACGKGDSQEEQIKERYPQAQIKYYSNTELALEAVDSGEVDCCLGDQAIPKFLKMHPACTVLKDDQGNPIVTSLDYSHPAVKPGDQRFLNWVNNWMDFHTVQGTIDKLKVEAYRAFELVADHFFVE